MRVIADRAWELWEGLEDREPGFQSDVWRAVFDEPLDTPQTRRPNKLLWFGIAAMVLFAVPAHPSTRYTDRLLPRCQS